MSTLNDYKKAAKELAPINQDIEDIVEGYAVNVVNKKDLTHEDFFREYDTTKFKAKAALAQRETDLLTYIADLYGLPLKELQRNVELWRSK